MPNFSKLSDIEDYLDQVKPVVFASGLKRPQQMPELMEFLGNPQEKYRVVHVAGTSGKTSTSYYSAALLCAAGKKVGLNISPHAEKINERVQINMQPLPEKEFCAEFALFLDTIEPGGFELNYFQVMTAFAFWEFARQKVDYAVIEVGIGGLLDSTNVVQRKDKVCIITDIGYGHTAILGKTLPEISAAKAGIIQPHNSVFCRQQSEEIIASVRAGARQKQADLHLVNEVSNYDFLPMFQQRNFAMALAAVNYTLEHDSEGQAVPPGLIKRAAQTRIPARLEKHTLGGRPLILDAAHNPQKIGALMQSLALQYPDQKMAVLFACTKGPISFYEGMLRELALATSHVIIFGFEPAKSGRFGSADPDYLLNMLREFGGKGEVVPDPAKAFVALRARTERLLVATGSVYALNHIREFVD